MARDASYWLYVTAAGLFTAMCALMMATTFRRREVAADEKSARPSELSVHSIQEIVTDVGGGGVVTSPLVEEDTYTPMEI